MHKLRNFTSKLRHTDKGKTKNSSPDQSDITNNNISTKDNISKNDSKESDILEIINDDTKNKNDTTDTDGIKDINHEKTNVFNGVSNETCTPVTEDKKYVNKINASSPSNYSESSNKETDSQQSNDNGVFSTKETNSHQYNTESDKNTDLKSTLEISTSKELNDLQSKESNESIDKEMIAKKPNVQNDEKEVGTKECCNHSSGDTKNATEKSVRSKSKKIVMILNKAKTKSCKMITRNISKANKLKDVYLNKADIDLKSQPIKPHHFNTYSGELELNVEPIPSHSEDLLSDAIFPDLAKVTETIDEILLNRPNIATIENNIEENSNQIDRVHLNDYTELQNDSATTEYLKEFDQVLAEVQKKEKLPISKAPSLESLDDIVLEKNLDLKVSMSDLHGILDFDEITDITNELQEINNINSNIDYDSKIVPKYDNDVISISSDDSTENDTILLHTNENSKTDESHKSLGEIKTYKVIKRLVLPKKLEATKHSNIGQPRITNETILHGQTQIRLKRIHNIESFEKVAIIQKIKNTDGANVLNDAKITLKTNTIKKVIESKNTDNPEDTVEEAKISEDENSVIDKTILLESPKYTEILKCANSVQTTTSETENAEKIPVEGQNSETISATDIGLSENNKNVEIKLQNVKEIKTKKVDNISDTKITEIENTEETNTKKSNSKNTQDIRSKYIRTTRIMNADAKTTEFRNIAETLSEEIKHVENAKEIKNCNEATIIEATVFKGINTSELRSDNENKTPEVVTTEELHNDNETKIPEVKILAELKTVNNTPEVITSAELQSANEIKTPEVNTSTELQDDNKTREFETSEELQSVNNPEVKTSTDLQSVNNPEVKFLTEIPSVNKTPEIKRSAARQSDNKTPEDKLLTEFQRDNETKTLDVKTAKLQSANDTKTPEVKTSTELQSDNIPEVKTSAELQSENHPEVKTPAELRSDNHPEVKTSAELQSDKTPEVKTSTEFQSAIETKKPDVNTAQLQSVNDTKTPEVKTSTELQSDNNPEVKTSAELQSDNHPEVKTSAELQSINKTPEIKTSAELDNKTPEVKTSTEFQSAIETKTPEVKTSTELQSDNNPEVKTSTETNISEIENTEEQKPCNDILDTISISSESFEDHSDIISITSSEDEIDDCGYHSSDFEFINEEEAKMDGFIINFDAERHGTKQRVKVKSKDNKNCTKRNDPYAAGPSRIMENYSQRDEDDEETMSTANDERDESYVVPQDNQVADMFRDMLPIPRSQILYLENKSIHTLTPMLVQYEGVGFDLSLAQHLDNADAQDREEANVNAEMIIDMYPEENALHRQKKRRRRR